MASSEPPISASRHPNTSTDLERGPPFSHARHSTAAASTTSTSSSSSSIMGDPDAGPSGGGGGADDEAWGPQHPCYPHLNPHVPLDSAEYHSTRIIRIRRDWLVSGDLAPTFSNVWPETLDAAGVSEDEFRKVIVKLNTELVAVFNPLAWRNVLDGVLGVVTGWFWEDLGLTRAKKRLRALEAWIERWNGEMEKMWLGSTGGGGGAEVGSCPPKIIPLRRTAYMSLDFQISDPEITHVSSPHSESPRPQS